jgi:hypothetical protein
MFDYGCGNSKMDGVQPPLAGKLKEKSLLYMVDKVMNIKQCL